MISNSIICNNNKNFKCNNTINSNKTSKFKNNYNNSNSINSNNNTNISFKMISLKNLWYQILK